MAFLSQFLLFLLFFVLDDNRATLNILTEDAQWTYLVKGAYPDNSLQDRDIKSKIDNKR